MQHYVKGYGTTTVKCYICNKERKMYGFLAIARQIWMQNEGLDCCDLQTWIIEQVEEE